MPPAAFVRSRVEPELVVLVVEDDPARVHLLEWQPEIVVDVARRSLGEQQREAVRDVPRELLRPGGAGARGAQAVSVVGVRGVSAAPGRTPVSPLVPRASPERSSCRRRARPRRSGPSADAAVRRAARLCTYPAATIVALVRLVILTGFVHVLPHAPLSPSWPVLLLPHAHTVPSVLTASACVPPATIAATPEIATSTGLLGDPLTPVLPSCP